MRALIVSSFVLPHIGGVEQFVETTREILRRAGWDVCVLACRPRTGEPRADVALPTRYVTPTEWPLPVGGWHRLWSEVGKADVVVANGTRQLLPILAIGCAFVRRKGCIAVLHGGETLTGGSFLYHCVLGSSFDWLLARPALRASIPVAVSRAGVAGAQRTYGIDAQRLPFPLRDLPPAGEPPELSAEEPLTVVWIGRLFPEKDPVTAVQAVERLRTARDATLDVYGEGLLRDELEELALSRPWLTLHGPRTWEEVLAIQSRAHVCLSSSSRDAVQVATLEALCRGIPVVSTRVGDAPDYYLAPALERFCVPPRQPEALADALLALARAYDETRSAFAANGRLLLEQHTSQAAAALTRLMEETRLSRPARRHARRPSS
jgi:glycosyltransferase involved in cell wall biosynthesis